MSNAVTKSEQLLADRRACRDVVANLYFSLYDSQRILLRSRVTTADQRDLRAVLREKFPRDHGQLLPALHFVQHEYRYLPDWAMEVVGWHLGIPASEVYGAATSYSELRIDEPGMHIVRVCTGLSCRVSGADSVLEAVRDRLGAEPGEPASVGSDATVTFETTACGFLCAVAPVMQIDERWLGHASPEKAVKAVNGLCKGLTA